MTQRRHELKVYKILSLFIIVVNLQCKDNCHETMIEFSNNIFQIKFDNSFDLNTNNSVTQYSGFFVCNNEIDTVYYKQGVIINNLSEIEPEVIYIPEGTDISNMDLSSVKYTNRINFDIDRYRKQNVTFEIIDGHEAKITYPRKSGDGITGIYFDSLNYGSSEDMAGIVSFHMYGKNLSVKSEKYLLDSFKSIKFK